MTGLLLYIIIYLLFTIYNGAMATERQKQLSFLYASQGPLVYRQYQRDRTKSADTQIVTYDVAYALADQNYTLFMDSFLEIFSGKKMHSPEIARWLVKQYLTHRHNGKAVQAEDFYKIAEDLRYFDALKSSKDFAGETDLAKYPTLSDFQLTLEPYKQKKLQRELDEAHRKMSPEARAKLMSETTILYDGPEGMVVIPHTPDASVHWGGNTKWCISARDIPKGGNMRGADINFPHYNAQSPVIILVPKNHDNNKAVIVNHVIWNSADATLNDLDAPHQTLITAAVGHQSADVRAGLLPWLSSFFGNLIDDDKGTPVETRHRSTAQHAYDQPLSQPDAALRAIMQDSNALKAVDKNLWDNRDFVLAAATHTIEAFYWAAKTIRQDPGFLRDLLKRSDDLAFMQDMPADVSPQDMREYRIAALERIAVKRDNKKFHNYARQFPELWGDRQLLFGNSAVILDKIKSFDSGNDKNMKNISAPTISR